MKRETLFVVIPMTSAFFAFLLVNSSIVAATPLSSQNGTISSIQV
jgi:hypothetical protein